MAFDGFTTKNIVLELNKKLFGSRVEKISVPTKNDIFISFHTQNRQNMKLLICIDANNARIHLSNHIKENPIKASQICMVLRKHLVGAKLIEIKQLGLDRVVVFSFQNLNELGDLVEKKLIVELMGKYSNVILTKSDNTIIDAIRHVDITMSSVRQVLPNGKYILPSTLGKFSLDTLSFEEFNSIISNCESATYNEDLLSNSLVGLSKSFAESILLELSLKNVQIDLDKTKLLYEKLKEFLASLDQNCFLFKLKENKKDYVIDIKNKVSDDSIISFYLDDFYHQKENVSILKTAKLNIQKDIESHISKLNKKLDLVNKTLDEAKDFEKYKEYGELINCNMHNISIGMEKVEVIDFYHDNVSLEIPLKRNFTPSKNAQAYFKKYNKLKNSTVHATKYKAEYENDISYLKSVLFELDVAESLEDVDEVRNELILEGFISKNQQKKKNKDAPSSPISYEYQGIKILVGRNNIQNDKLTFKIAKKNYTWLHIKNFHGSHVIIESEEINDDLLFYAATLAVKHSEVKNISKVEVDYCLVKNVYKENGSKPGMVHYTNYHTIVVG